MAGARQLPDYSSPQEITGPWTVQFDPKWGGPESVVFEQLSELDPAARGGHQVLLGHGDLPQDLRSAWNPARGQASGWRWTWAR